MQSTDRHTIIVGGAVIGVCCAYYLVKRGARVTVLERDQVGRAASFGNAGLFPPDHPPINKPGRVRQALKSLLHPLSPPPVAPKPNPSLARWLDLQPNLHRAAPMDGFVRFAGTLEFCGVNHEIRRPRPDQITKAYPLSEHCGERDHSI